MLGEGAGAIIGAFGGGTGGALAGTTACAPSGPGAIACGFAGGAAGGTLGAAKGAAIGTAIGGAIDATIAFAKKVDIKQVDQAVRQALGRKPTDPERGAFRKYIHEEKEDGLGDFSFQGLLDLAKNFFGGD